MPGLTELVLDRWSTLSHKGPLRRDAENLKRKWTAKTWVPPEDARRLNAYIILEAYRSNVSRAFLNTDDADEEAENREYGDAALVVDQVLSHLLGEDQTIVVPGAEDYDPNLEATIVAAIGEPDPETGVTRGLTPDELDQLERNAAARVLAEREDFLRDWAHKVHLDLRVTDNETNAVKLGDGVLLLGWDADKERPTCAVMNPGFYFPVLDDDSIDAYDYPTTVHFAWEIEGDPERAIKPKLRRISYRLEDIHSTVRRDPETGDDVLVDPEDASGSEETGWERVYPWNDGEPSGLSCYMSDGTWELDSIDDAIDYDHLDESEATWRELDGDLLRDFDMNIDFVPVIHVPNTPPGGDHFGESSLAVIIQILDDLQNADTDAQKASSTTGSPIIGVSGARVTTAANARAGTVGQYVIRGGEVWELGDNGKLSVVDTSAMLAEQGNYVGRLRDRLSVNSRLPAVVLGTMDPSQAPSGFAMQLSFGPLASMIRNMRLTRGVKYPLLLKMVQRLYQSNGGLDEGPSIDAEYRFGSFLPTDQSAALELVTSGVGADVISLETGIRMLIAAGFPIEDAADEIAAIQSRAFAEAGELADATGDTNDAREYLGLEPVATVTDSPTPPTPPVPTPTPPTVTE